MKYVIDAQGKKLGRVASEAASILRGKNLPSFAPQKMPTTQVEIQNASKLDISEKQRETTYTRYSGYPGGLKKMSLRELVAKRGYSELLRKTILGMLPRNTHKMRIIKHLSVKD